MQVFMPYPDYNATAQCLDDRRLFKQSLECKQIMSAILGLSTGWKNHCITRLWGKFHESLNEYWWEINMELANRGKKFIPCFSEYKTVEKPFFIGQEYYHSAYRSHLLNKDEKFYRGHGWTEEAVSGYWSINKEGMWMKFSVK